MLWQWLYRITTADYNNIYYDMFLTLIIVDDMGGAAQNQAVVDFI